MKNIVQPTDKTAVGSTRVDVDYDVIVVGGSYSGSASALLLKHQFPNLRILIIERSEVFSRKVGESTSELAGCFLTRVLKQGQHLALNHVTKHGLRAWFHRDSDDPASSVTELGPALHNPYPTYQINRYKLDTHLLEEAESLGCEVMRPAKVIAVHLNGVGRNEIEVRAKEEEPKSVTGTWVIDASGKAAMIAREQNLWRSMAEKHPVSSMWSRFQNVCDLDSVEAGEQLDSDDQCVYGQRGSSTNHLMGYGWWSWIIPLDNGEVSVGVTWDERFFKPPTEGKMADRIKEHLLKHPIGRLMFGDAVAVEDDNNYYKNLPYFSEETFGEGWAIVGDAAGFMDPLYSQGLDFCSHTVYNAYTLIREYYKGGSWRCELESRKGTYRHSFLNWFRALYQDKYQYIGDSELMYTAYLLDLSHYFLGPVRFVYTDQDGQFSKLPFHGTAGNAVGSFMAFYNRRLGVIARKKIASGTYGNKNCQNRFITPFSFTTGKASVRLGLLGLRRWLAAECRYFLVKPAEVPEASVETPIPTQMNA